MIDRGIGIAGIALALIFGVLPYFAPRVPKWVSLSGVGVGVFLLGWATGLVVSSDRLPSRPAPVDRAVLRMHVFADSRHAERLGAENIFRWYYLRNEVVGVSQSGEKLAATSFPTLFVSFEPEVRISTLKVQSPNISLPRYEVKEFNQRFAIIAFSGPLSEGTLEISVEP